MKKLAKQSEGKVIDFFNPARQINKVVKDRLLADVALINIKLHLIVHNENGRLDAGRIGSSVPE
ncbi:MAG: hypothetical protein MUQ51_06925 [Pseudomonadota bacterium]|nr:hypothetical protein [Pseudomonadota bacterium]MDO7711332.1 hypothetical protein [Pseudomonadota bacterium]